MLTALEIGWEASGVARLRGLLEVGNSRWQGRPAPGYPVDRVQNFIGHYVVAWGTDAALRRQSRVELWQRQGAFCQAVLYPQTDGRDTYFVATTPAAAAQLDPDPATFLEQVRKRPRMQHEAVASFVRRGPEIKLAVEHARQPARDPQPIRHGLALQLRIPYGRPDIIDLRLNGHQLLRDARDGYQTWVADGFTMLQINVPPEKSQVEDLYLVTCSYLPDAPRRYGWQPPTAVTRRLHEERD
jgi:hypothetical protein